MVIRIYNARIVRSVYLLINGDESSVLYVSLQVTEDLATTFLRNRQEEVDSAILDTI